MFRFLTAGESHGQCLTVIVEGLPAGLPLGPHAINLELARRQQGYGRGGRMKIEKDAVLITSGVRHGETLGSPLAMTIQNRDWENWRTAMAIEPLPGAMDLNRLTRPRPGHADLVGALKYQRKDLRDILERASARETAARVAVGAVAKALLSCFSVHLGSWVEAIGKVAAKLPEIKDPKPLVIRAAKSEVHCPDVKASVAMQQAIDRAAKAGDTLGGIFTVAAWGLVPGLGSHVHWDRRLDTRLAGAMMSIPAIKGVEIGLGFALAQLPGSQAHDVISYRKHGRQGRYGRKSDHAGGTEGGMSTGEPLLIRAAMKPIATLRRALASVDIKSKQVLKAGYERSDICAVPAAAVVGEAMVAIELARAWQEKFGGDSIAEIRANWQQYLRLLAKS